MRHRYGPILSNVYVHSSVVNELRNEFWDVFGRKNVENENDKSKNRIILHFIWKQGKKNYAYFFQSKLAY